MTVPDALVTNVCRPEPDHCLRPIPSSVHEEISLLVTGITSPGHRAVSAADRY
jgi:hypothetical protein